jgi:hypothetical protein
VKLFALSLAVALPVFAAPAKTITIAYQGDVGGEVAPCG